MAAPPTEVLPSLEQAILAFLRQQEENGTAEEGESSQASSEMGFPDDVEPTFNAAKSEVLRQGPILVAGGKEAVKSLTPFALQICGSYLAYNAGLGIFQLAGLGLRVSCNSRLWGPCLGCIGVGVASAFAGQASRRVHKGLVSGRPLLAELAGSPPWQDWQMQQALLDALVGMSAFKLLGGEFRRIMPSDLRYPGAFAKGSLPTTRSAKDNSTAYLQHGPNRVHLEKMLVKDGCHSCGKRGGGLHADHMPPNKLYKEAKAEAARQAARPHRVFLNNATKKLPKPWRDRARELMMRVTDSGTPNQHFYPHCTACSNKQGQVLGNGSRGPLVLHRLGVPPGPLPGILAGFRFFTDLQGPPAPPSPRGGRGSAARGSRAASKKPGPPQQQPSSFPFPFLGCAPHLPLPSMMQAVAAQPPKLLIGYDSEDEVEAAGEPAAAADMPALVLRVAEQQAAASDRMKNADLWAFSVRITPEDLASLAPCCLPPSWHSNNYLASEAEEARQGGSIGSIGALPMAGSSSGSGMMGLPRRPEAGVPPPQPLPGPAHAPLASAWLCEQDRLGSNPQHPQHPQHLQNLQHLQHSQPPAALGECRGDDVAWLDTTTPRVAKRGLFLPSLGPTTPDAGHRPPTHSMQHAQLGSSSTTPTCAPRHTLSPALQAVLSELLRTSAGMDFAAAQRQQRELEEVRHQRWQQQHQFNTGQQAHVVNEMDRNSCHREPASQVDSSEQCLEQKQQQQQQQQQQPQLASSSDISPRSKPLHAYMHSHGQLVQQQWQREQMLRNWRIHH